MMCSPYLTGSLVIMLVIVAFNYWTIAAENSELGKKLQEMQQQLKSGTNHIKNLEEEIQQVRSKESKCKKNTENLREEAEIKLKDMETVQKQRNKLKAQVDKLEVQLKDTQNEEDEEESKLIEDNKMKENTIDSLRDEIESLKLNISAVQLNVTSCQAELASERADRLIQPPQGAGQGMPPRHLPSKLGPGQLPDLNPDAVSVIRKETNGMTFHTDQAGHWLPIIVQGDPHKPRARPSVSVMDIKPPSNRVKKNASVLGSPSSHRRGW